MLLDALSVLGVTQVIDDFHPYQAVLEPRGKKKNEDVEQQLDTRRKKERERERERM